MIATFVGRMPKKALLGTVYYFAFFLAAFYTPCHSETLRIVVAGDDRADYPSPDRTPRSEDKDGINQLVSKEIAQAVLVENAKILLWTGDLVNVTESGTFEKNLLAWRAIMQPLYDHGVVVLPVRGNHEVEWYPNDTKSPIPHATKIWNAVFSGKYALPSNGPENERNLSFYYTSESALIIGVDQYEGHSHSINQGWLSQVFKNENKPFVFLYGHEPAFMAGRHDDRDTLAAEPLKRNEMLGSFIRAGGRVYFCGHDHFYDHAVVRDTAGVGPEMHQLTAGTAGAPCYKGCDYKGNQDGWELRPIRHIDYAYGYILIEIREDIATITFKGQLSPGNYVAMDTFNYTAPKR
jgi:hypothetical protein